MATSSPHPTTFVRLVVYCDEEPEPYTLPDMHLPRNLEELRRIVEDTVGQRAKLLSYWNYGHNRYELLREVKALLQEDARVPAGSPSKSRQDSRRQSLEREAGTDTSTSHSGRSSAVAATLPSSRVYRCQLWLETVLLQLDPLDPQRDAAEYDDLHGHVARWLGNKHVGYEVRDAVRIRCPFLTRMFDETRSTRLVGNQDKVQLLYYSNNAWGVRDVLQYGFLLNRGVPTSMTAVVQAQSGASDISTTTDTRLSIPVPPNAQGPSASGPTDSQPAPPSPVDDALDSQAHPFIFTSSMLGPNVKHLPAHTAPHKVLLCEVAPGRRFMTDQSLTGEHTDKQSFPLPSLKTPRGYDSVCYTRTKDDKAGLRSGDEVSAKAEDLAVVQVQVAHSYQALPRYLVTVAPTGVPPPAPSSFDSAVSATASPVRAPGSTAAAAAAREDVEKQRAAEAASRPSRLREWWSANPFQSRKRAEAKNEGTPLRRPGSASAPTPGMASAPRSALESPNTRRHSDRYGNSSSENVAPQRAALALTTPRHHTESSRRFSGTPYPDSEYGDDRGGEAVRTPRAYSSSQSQPHPAGAAGPLQSPTWLSPSRPSFAHDGLHQACGAEGGPPPQQMSLNREGNRNQNTSTPARPSQPRVSGGLTLAPPTPLSPAHRGSSPDSRNGILYSGLQPGARRKSDGVSAPHQPLQPHSQDILERSGFSRNAHSASQDGMVERPWTRPLIPVYHDTAEALNSSNDRYGDSGGGGGVGAPLPGPLPRPSIMRQRAPSFSSSPLQRPAQAPPAAFNHFLCAIHPRQLQSLYCTACEELTCAYCASIGAHRDHVVVEASNQVTAVYAEAHKLQEELRHWLSEYRRTEQELHAEQAKAAARQQRELRTLQQNFQLLRQSLQQAERSMAQTVQQRTCPPPLAEATAVVNKYVQALTPLSAMLNRYHAAQEQGRASASPPAGGARGATSSLPEMLHFLRVAPSLVHRVQESFVQHQKDEERRLRDGIAEYRTRVATTEGTYDQVDWMGLRRLLEHIGSSRSTRATNTAATRERSPCHPSPPRVTPVTAALSFSGLGSADKSGGRTGSAVRVRGRTSLRSSPTRNAAAADSRDVSRRLLGRSPVRPLVIGDDPAAYMSHQPSPSPSCKRDRLLLRCLADLQRGHIWAIQDASAYFAPGQLKAVCSTAFRLLGVQWELRIAPLPSSHRRASTTSFITPGINAGLMATTASTLPPADREGGMDGVVARSPLATQSWLDEERAVLDPSASVRGGAPEEEWLGFFLFPLQHRLRMDFRVIAFSEVTWAEWQVTGWTPEMVGKGWGLYPFLQRKELMRTDKLARDNIVKICIAPISDLY